MLSFIPKKNCSYVNPRLIGYSRRNCPAINSRAQYFQKLDSLDKKDANCPTTSLYKSSVASKIPCGIRSVQHHTTSYRKDRAASLSGD